MLIAFCAVGVILWIGGHDVFAGRLTAGELSAFVFYAVVVATGAGTVSEVWGEIQRAAGATERLMELLDTRPAIVARRAASAAARARARHRASTRSTFAYPARPDAPALDRFSLRGVAGRARGAGRPLGRGQVHGVRAAAALLRSAVGRASRIDGVDLRDMRSARRCARLIAVVPQDPVIFAASVLDNVRYGRPGGEPRGGASAPASGARAGIHRAPAAGPRHASSASAA